MPFAITGLAAARSSNRLENVYAAFMPRLGPLIYGSKRDYRERANRISNAEAFVHRFVVL